MVPWRQWIFLAHAVGVVSGVKSFIIPGFRHLVGGGCVGVLHAKYSQRGCTDWITKAVVVLILLAMTGFHMWIQFSR
jgi:hypothetical protein